MRIIEAELGDVASAEAAVQRVRGDVETLRAAHELLDRLEALWRERLDRIDDILTEPHQVERSEGESPCP